MERLQDVRRFLMMSEFSVNEKSDWLIDWFKKRSATFSGPAEEQYEINYFDAGFIDSMGVMDLIVEIESEFNIRFTEKHFQDRRFPFIQGLATIIDEIQNA